jgi:hypothetical protein
MLLPDLPIGAVTNIHAGINAMKTLRTPVPMGGKKSGLSALPQTLSWSIPKVPAPLKLKLGNAVRVV